MTGQKRKCPTTASSNGGSFADSAIASTSSSSLESVPAASSNRGSLTPQNHGRQRLQRGAKDKAYAERLAAGTDFDLARIFGSGDARGGDAINDGRQHSYSPAGFVTKTRAIASGNVGTPSQQCSGIKNDIISSSGRRNENTKESSKPSAKRRREGDGVERIIPPPCWPFSDHLVPSNKSSRNNGRTKRGHPQKLASQKGTHTSPKSDAPKRHARRSEEADQEGTSNERDLPTLTSYRQAKVDGMFDGTNSEHLAPHDEKYPTANFYNYSTDDAPSVIDGVTSVDDANVGLSNVARRSCNSNTMHQNAFPSTKQCAQQSPFATKSAKQPYPAYLGSKKDSTDWSCNQCTLRNSNRQKKCLACGVSRHLAVGTDGTLTLDRCGDGVRVYNDDDDGLNSKNSRLSASIDSGNVLSCSSDNRNNMGKEAFPSATKFAELSPSTKQTVKHPSHKYPGPPKNSLRPSTDWSCNQCTLLNSNRRKNCLACGIPRHLAVGTDGTLTLGEFHCGNGDVVCDDDDGRKNLSSTPLSSSCDSSNALACDLKQRSQERESQQSQLILEMIGGPVCTRSRRKERLSQTQPSTQPYDGDNDEGRQHIRSPSHNPALHQQPHQHQSDPSELRKWIRKRRDSKNEKRQRQKLVEISLSASALREVKAEKVQNMVGREHATLLNESCESTARMGNGMAPQSDSMANHAAEPSSHQLMAYVPTAVLCSVKGRSYNVSISNGTKKAENHHASVDSKDCEDGLAEEQPQKEDDHRKDLNIQQISAGSESKSRHDNTTMRDATNALVNMQHSTSKNPRMKAWRSPTSPSKSSPSVDIDFDDSFAPVYHDITDKPSSSPCHNTGSCSREDEDAECLDDTSPDSSGGEAIIVDKSTQGNVSCLDASELVQTNSFQSSQGAISTDLPFIQMTQQPTFDYFSQVSYSSWPCKPPFSNHLEVSLRFPLPT